MRTGKVLGADTQNLYKTRVLLERGTWGIILTIIGTRMERRPWLTLLCLQSDGIILKNLTLNVTREGNNSNNVLFDDQTFKAANNNWITMHNFSPFIDTNPEVPDEQRYKAVSGYGEGLGEYGLYT